MLRGAKQIGQPYWNIFDKRPKFFQSPQKEKNYYGCSKKSMFAKIVPIDM